MFTLALALSFVATPCMGKAAPPSLPQDPAAASDVLVTWLPAIAPPDAAVSYKVQARVAAGNWTTLTETTYTYAFVQQGYSEYGVLVVVDGVESSRSSVCVRVDPSNRQDPVSIHPGCLDTGGGPRSRSRDGQEV